MRGGGACSLFVLSRVGVDSPLRAGSHNAMLSAGPHASPHPQARGHRPAKQKKKALCQEHFVVCTWCTDARTRTHTRRCTQNSTPCLHGRHPHAAPLTCLPDALVVLRRYCPSTDDLTLTCTRHPTREENRRWCLERLHLMAAEAHAAHPGAAVAPLRALVQWD